MKILTSEEYVMLGGCRCPYCGSTDLSGQDFDMGVGLAWQDVSCLDCGKGWRDQYTLTGWQYTLTGANPD